MANPLYGQNKADTAIDDISTLNADGLGVHEYYEVIDIATGDDNDVVGSLSILLPAQVQIMEAALIVHRIATNAYGDVALEYHNAAVADDAASGGTEMVGEDVASNVSLPDNDCDCSSAGTVGAVIHMGTLAQIQRSTAITYLQVCAKEDLSSMTGSPQVGVYVKWFGKAASAI